MKIKKKLRIFRSAPLAFLIITSSCTIFTDKNVSFYDKILSDFNTHSYFVAVDISTPSYTGRAIIENNNLYSFLNKTEGFDKIKYQSFMKHTLVHHRTLRIENKGHTILNFIKVPEVEDVIKSANKGENNFIANYFTGVMLNYGIPLTEESAIISQLFYWDIPAKIDKISNELIIG